MPPGASCRSSVRASTARRSTSTSRSKTGPACSRASPRRSRSATSRSRDCCSIRTGRARSGASTGNTAASAAAYAARAGLPAVVLTPAGAIAAPKQAQARAVGARVLEVRGTFDEALRSCQELSDRGTFTLVNSLNPHRIEGQKTAAFEVIEELGRVPDVLALPYGGGGNITAYAKGFAEEGATLRLIGGQAS